MTFRIIALTLTILLLPTIAISQAKNRSSKSETEVRQADDDFQEAFLNEDAAALEKLLTDSFIWTHSTGNIQNKALILANVRTGKTQYDRVETDDVKVHLYKNAAVISGRSTRQYPGKDVFWIRYTAFYIRDKGKWRASAFHSSHGPDPSTTPK